MRGLNLNNNQVVSKSFKALSLPTQKLQHKQFCLTKKVVGPLKQNFKLNVEYYERDDDRRYSNTYQEQPERRRPRQDYGAQNIQNDQGKLFISNLSEGATWQELKEVFNQAGNVLFARTFRGNSGSYFGIVKYATAEEAQQGIETFNETEFQGQPMYVRMDRQDNRNKYQNVQQEGGYGARQNFQERGSYQGRNSYQERAPRQQYDQNTTFQPRQLAEQYKDNSDYEVTDEEFKEKYGLTDQISGQQLLVYGLPYELSWQDLKDIFKKEFEDVLSVQVKQDEYGRSKGFGTVRFGTRKSAKEAIEKFDRYVIGSRYMTLRYDKYI